MKCRKVCIHFRSKETIVTAPPSPSRKIYVISKVDATHPSGLKSEERTMPCPPQAGRISFLNFNFNLL